LINSGVYLITKSLFFFTLWVLPDRINVKIRNYSGSKGSLSFIRVCSYIDVLLGKDRLLNVYIFRCTCSMNYAITDDTLRKYGSYFPVPPPFITLLKAPSIICLDRIGAGSRSNTTQLSLLTETLLNLSYTSRFSITMLGSTFDSTFNLSFVADHATKSYHGRPA
jgi:hypothetical protein